MSIHDDITTILANKIGGGALIETYTLVAIGIDNEGASATYLITNARSTALTLGLLNVGQETMKKRLWENDDQDDE